MKKALLLLFICSSVLARAQTSTLYVTSKFNDNNLEAIKNYVASVISKKYILTSFDTHPAAAMDCKCANFGFSSDVPTDQITVGITYSVIHRDTIISSVSISGLYNELGNIYKKFVPDADLENLKYKTQAPYMAVINGKVQPYDVTMPTENQITIDFHRLGGRSWMLDMKLFEGRYH